MEYQMAKKAVVSAVKSADESAPIKVKAKAMGYYGGEIKDEGDVFIISDKKAFSKNWMIDLSGSIKAEVEEEEAEVKDELI